MMARGGSDDWWQTLFDGVYLKTDARTVGDEELTRREVEVICQLLPIHPGNRILDLCGGHGRHSLELCRRGFDHCTVLDCSAHLIEHGRRCAAQRGLSVRFLHGDARETGLRSGTFDHILIMGNALGYIPQPDADLHILAEALRVLRRGGYLLIDAADLASVQARFRPDSWHECDDLVVCRRRELEGNVIQVREVVLSKGDGLVRDCTYAVRLYDSDALCRVAKGAGYADVRVRTDFIPQVREGDFGFMDRRMIVTARKP